MVKDECKMNWLENDNNIRHLPDKKGKIFETCYQSRECVFVSTASCPPPVLDKIVGLLDREGLSWLKQLRTSTSRELFLGQLDKVDHLLPDVIFKKSRFSSSASGPISFQPGSANEIKSNLLLNNVVEKQVKSGELAPPDGFDSLSVRVEQPIGILVDRQNKSKHSVFIFERGFDVGEILQYADPPMEGAVNYIPRDWKLFCGIKDVLEKIAQAASREGLIMQDYDIHQVLYRTDESSQNLKLVLLGSEYFWILSRQQARKLPNFSPHGFIMGFL